MRRLALLIALAAFGAQLEPLDEAGYGRMLRAHRGHVVLVDFWATWCDSCREEMPHLVQLAEKLKVQLVMVSADEPEQEGAAGAFLEKQGVRGIRYIKRTANDQRFIDSIDPKWSGALPAVFVYDPSGARLASLVGEAAPAEIEDAVKRATR